MTEADTLKGLLAQALDVIYHDAESLIGGASLLEKGVDQIVPREGTLEPDVRQDAEELLSLIRRIEAHGVRPVSEQPAWLIEIVGRQRRL